MIGGCLQLNDHSRSIWVTEIRRQRDTSGSPVQSVIWPPYRRSSVIHEINLQDWIHSNDPSTWVTCRLSSIKGAQSPIRLFLRRVFLRLLIHFCFPLNSPTSTSPDLTSKYWPRVLWFDLIWFGQRDKTTSFEYRPTTFDRERRYYSNILIVCYQFEAGSRGGSFVGNYCFVTINLFMEIRTELRGTGLVDYAMSNGEWAFYFTPII